MRRDLARPITPSPLPPGFVLLPYNRERILACRALLKRIYPEGLGDGGITDEDFLQWLTNDAEFDAELVFIAGHDGAVAGFAHCWSANFIKDLAVEPSLRRQGLGSALTTLALEAFATRGAPYVDLKTDVDNIKAQSLYRRLGFEIVERVG